MEEGRGLGFPLGMFRIDSGAGAQATRRELADGYSAPHMYSTHWVGIADRQGVVLCRKLAGSIAMDKQT